MKFSIIIPVYNTQKYIAKCIDSIKKQRCNDYQVVLVNDGSTDNSLAVIKKCIEGDRRFSIINQENKGQYMARLAGINFSTGDYILFVDSDDEINEKTLEVLNSTIIETQNPDIIIYNASRSEKYDDALYNYGTPLNSCRIFREHEKEYLYSIIIKSHDLNSMCLKCFKRSLFNSTDVNYSNIQSIRNGEDLIQFLPLITKANNVVCLNHILYFYRINEHSASRAYSPSYFDSRKIIYIYLKDYLKKWGMDNDRNKRALGERMVNNTCDAIYNIRFADCSTQITKTQYILKSKWLFEILDNINLKKLKIANRLMVFAISKRSSFLILLLLRIRRLLDNSIRR